MTYSLHDPVKSDPADTHALRASLMRVALPYAESLRSRPGLVGINAERGVSMLLVEQNASVALAVADYGYIMETGKVVIDGSAEKLATDPDVREFYLGIGAEGR